MFSFTLPDLIDKHRASGLTNPALQLGPNELTYGELARRVDSTAAWLNEQGVRRGHRVAIHLHKSFEEAIAVFAVARLGAIFVDVSYKWTLRQLAYVIDDCGVKVLITDRRKALALELEGVFGRVDHVLTANGAVDHPKCTAWSDIPDGAPPEDCRPIDADVAALQYTSGSTGRPKGVMVTHLNFIDGTRRVGRYLKNRAGDRILGLVPMSAPWGVLQVTTMFMLGGTVVLQPVVFAADIVKTLATHSVTGMAAFPETWIDMVRYLEETPTPLPSLRYITSSGGKIPQPILDALPRVFPGVEINLTYGLTEAFRSMLLPPDRYHDKMGSFGKPVANVDVFVVDPVKGLCGPGETGELIHRGTLLTKGYWENPEATAERMRPCEALRPLIGDELVHYSGDLVRIDEEGFYWFVGREDAMIKTSGYRMSPTEIEEIVYESGLVTNAVAFGATDDEMLGQGVYLAVARDSGPVDLAALEAHCRREMPHYMVPRRIHAWDGAMPRTANGKIDRQAVIAGSGPTVG